MNILDKIGTRRWRPPDLEGLRAPSPCAFIARTWPASIMAGRALQTPAALALAVAIGDGLARKSPRADL
jgi:hypothetical protein